MLEKYSSEFWESIGLAPSQPPQELQMEEIPSEQLPISSTEEFSNYIPDEETSPNIDKPLPKIEFIDKPIEFIEDPLPPKPVETIPESPEKPQSFKFLSEEPTWYNPEWKFPGSYQPKENNDELKDFEHFKILDLPWAASKDKTQANKIEITKPEITKTPQVIAPEVPVKPIQDLSNFNNAKNYLLSLKGTDTIFDTISNAIEGVTPLLEKTRQNRSQKTLANSLGFALGSIDALLRKQDSFGNNKEQIIQAANTLRNFYSEQTKNLDPKFQDNVNNQIILQVDGPKPRPLQRRSSRFHGENIIFNQNRAIDIMRNEGTTVQQAEEQAQEDWDGIVETINNYGSSFSPGDQATFRAMFAKAILGGDTYEDAQQYIIGLIQRSNTQKDTFYENIDLNSESEDDIIEALQDFAEPEFVSKELEEIPDEYKDSLITNITEFAELAFNLIKAGADWKDQITHQHQMPIELQDQIQQAYNKAIAISGKIASTPQDIKEKAYENGDIFKDIYITTALINKYTDTFGIEQVDQTDPIAAAEAFDLGLTIQDPTKKPLTEEEKALPQKKRIRNKEVEARANKKYMDFIKYKGDLAGYYNQRAKASAMNEPVLRGKGIDRRLETQEELAARREPAQEKRRIKNPDRNLIVEEANGWIDIGLSKGNPRNSINTLRRKHINALTKLWRSINRSWLPDNILQELISLRFNDRVNKLTEALNQIKSYPPKANQEVITALEEHIQSLPKLFEETKDLVQQESVRSSRQFRPGEWTEYQQQKRRGKTSNIEYFTNTFYKYSLLT